MLLVTNSVERPLGVNLEMDGIMEGQVSRTERGVKVLGAMKSVELGVAVTGL